MVVCPSCRGAKAEFGVMCGDRGCRPGAITCDFCQGEGQVSTEAEVRWREGHAMRQARVKLVAPCPRRRNGLGLIHSS